MEPAWIVVHRPPVYMQAKKGATARKAPSMLTRFEKQASRIAPETLDTLRVIYGIALFGAIGWYLTGMVITMPYISHATRKEEDPDEDRLFSHTWLVIVTLAVNGGITALYFLLRFLSGDADRSGMATWLPTVLLPAAILSGGLATFWWTRDLLMPTFDVAGLSGPAAVAGPATKWAYYDVREMLVSLMFTLHVIVLGLLLLLNSAPIFSAFRKRAQA